MKKIMFILSAAVFFFSCGESEKGTSLVSEGTHSEGQDAAVEVAETAVELYSVPAVVLRDEAKVWENNNGELSEASLATLDLGTEVTYLGIDEELKSGSNIYKYSKVRLKDGTEGWVSTVRLAKNSLPAVIVEQTDLYGKPSMSAPLKRSLPASQIVGVSLEKGEVNGFAQVKFSYYEANTISYPETGYVPYNKLSSFSGDIEVSKLILKAMRNPEQKNDFLKIAFTQKTVFRTEGSFPNGGLYFSEPASEDEPISVAEDTIHLLAVNPHSEGNALSWYLAMNGVGELVWVDAGMRANPLQLAKDISDSVFERPAISDKSTYAGSGIPSVSLYQGLSLRVPKTDKEGKESFVRESSLEMGEVVYALDNERDVDGITFQELELPGDESGWSSFNYIAQNARPAVILEDDVFVYSDSKLTSLLKFKLMRNQIIAVHDEAFDGFMKISYVSMVDDSLHREVFIQSGQISFSYKTEDVTSALLLHKITLEEDREMRDVYFKNALLVSSYLSGEWGDIYYGVDDESSAAEESLE